MFVFVGFCIFGGVAVGTIQSSCKIPPVPPACRLFLFFFF